MMVGLKHVAIKIRNTKYVVMFDGNYKHLVYFVSSSVFDAVRQVLVGTVHATYLTV